jgi:hypothetical protein
MASGIFTHAMRSAVPDDGPDSAVGDHRSEAGDDGSRGHRDGGHGGTASTIGKRTSFVDRQVARRARSRSKTRRIRHLRILAALLVVAVVVTAIGWILSWTRVQTLESEALHLDSQLRKAQGELETIRARLAERETEVRTLVEGRIPGLIEIQYNKLIDVNDRYVVNLTISEAGIEDDRHLEYHIVLKNDTSGIILPAVKIFLFDAFGLQIGVSSVERRHATSITDFAELSPGETRSYHAKLAVERDSTPKYYMLHVQ